MTQLVGVPNLLLYSASRKNFLPTHTNSPPQTTLHSRYQIKNSGTGVEDEPASELSSAPWQRHALLPMEQFVADYEIEQGFIWMYIYIFISRNKNIYQNLQVYTKSLTPKYQKMNRR